MPTTVDAPWVADLLREQLGAEVDRVRPLQGSVTNASFLAGTDRGPVVVKTCRVWDWTNETARLRRLAGLTEVPTARLLAAGAGECHWIVLEAVAGRPAASDDERARAGHAVRALHGIVADGWGPAAAPADSWAQVLRRGLAEDLDDVVAAGLLEPADAVALREAVEQAPPYRGTPRLLHGDLKDVHLHCHPDHTVAGLAALLDWGDASAGDPLYDLARYGLEGPERLAALLRGYGPVELDPQRMRAYRLRFTLDCLATELRQGGDWFDTYRRRLAADLA